MNSSKNYKITDFSLNDADLLYIIFCIYVVLINNYVESMLIFL